jgi:hypothetical protein
LGHEEVVVEHGRVVHGETPTVGHSETLRHLYYIRKKFVYLRSFGSTDEIPRI